MIYSADIPHEPGVFTLVHNPTKLAYVGVCNDLRHRVTIWERNFRELTKDPEFVWPLKKMPMKPGEEYTFYANVNVTPDEVRKWLRDAGYTIVNEFTRTRRLITFKGKQDTVRGHCRTHGKDYNSVYHQLRRGKKLEELL